MVESPSGSFFYVFKTLCHIELGDLRLDERDYSKKNMIDDLSF